VYPEIAQAAHVQGAVVLHAVISKTGDVENLSVISGPPMLTSAAIEAVKQWRYKPYLLNGQPMEVETTVNVNFTYGGDGAATPSPEGSSAARPPIFMSGTPPASPGRPLRVSAGVAAGMAISMPQPVYPQDAKAAHIQGTVVLHALISKTGEIENLQVISGPKELVQSALHAVNQWKYKPYLLNGQPTEVETTININYTLGEDAPGQAAQYQYLMPGVVEKIGGSVSAPALIYKVDPEFTAKARKAKASGTVLLGLVVDKQGLPKNVHVLRGFGIGPDGRPDPKLKKAARAAADGMNQNAVDAVTQYKFKPATEEGKPVPVELSVEVNYKIF
jgi:TonB family protein